MQAPAGYIRPQPAQGGNRGQLQGLQQPGSQQNANDDDDDDDDGEDQTSSDEDDDDDDDGHGVALEG